MIERLPERLRLRLDVVIEDGREHWLWTGARFVSGYGRVKARRPDGRWTARRAHRVIYEALVGPIPAGHDLHHGDGCRRILCCNPACLQPLTPADHQRLHANRNGDHCRRGHPYDEANTYWRHDGYRECRACRRIAEALRERRRAAA